MGYVETLHAEHLARLARMKGRPEPEPVVPKPEPVRVDPVVHSDFVSHGTPTMDAIIRAVCRHFAVEFREVIGNRRRAKVILPRHVAMYLCSRLTLRSLPLIGRKFGGRDHTTVLHAIAKIERLLVDDEHMQAHVEFLTHQIGPDISAQREPHVKLTEHDVREIRASHESNSELSCRFNVHRATVSHIRNFHSWKHVR